MKAMVVDSHKTTLPKDLQEWANRRKELEQDRAIRQDFFAIQEEISEILCTQVIRSGGMFHGSTQPHNSEIDKRLAM